MKAFVRGAILALWLGAGSLGGLSVGVPGVAAAQDEDAAEERAMAFEASEGAQTENIPGGALMIAAYGVVWWLVLGYVVHLGFQQSSTSQDIERLRRDLKAAEENASGGD